MDLNENMEFFERVVGLIRRKSTGNVNEFASKLSRSKRTVQRLIQEK